MPTLAVFDFNHPKVWIETALFGDRGIDGWFVAFDQDHPLAITRHQIKTALVATRHAIQCIHLYQNSARRVIAALDDKRGYFDQTQAGQIGRDPDISGQSHRGLDVAVFEIETHFSVAFGFFQPVWPHLHLEKKMDTAPKEFFQFQP
jgi:hypothetical protein